MWSLRQKQTGLRKLILMQRLDVLIESFMILLSRRRSNQYSKISFQQKSSFELKKRRRKKKLFERGLDFCEKSSKLLSDKTTKLILGFSLKEMTLTLILSIFRCLMNESALLLKRLKRKLLGISSTDRLPTIN